MSAKKPLFALLLLAILAFSLSACGQTSGATTSAGDNSASSSKNSPDSNSNNDESLTIEGSELDGVASWQGFEFPIMSGWEPHPYNKDKVYGCQIDPASPSRPSRTGGKASILEVWSSTAGKTESLDYSWESLKSTTKCDTPSILKEWSEGTINYTAAFAESDDRNIWILLCDDAQSDNGVALRLSFKNENWPYKDQQELFAKIVNNAKYNEPSKTTIDSFSDWASSSTSSADTAAPSPSSPSSGSDQIPTEYKSALNKAQSYNDKLHMSKASLYDQLASEYGEKFTAEAAQYAVDNVKADWKSNALVKAKEYQSMMDMSPAAIYDQLVSEYGENFTADEAQYAVDNL